MTAINKSGRGGYSLIEISLAILVAGVGLLTVYSLLPAGLKMNQYAIDDTEVALFAEEVLGGLHGKIDGDTNAWARMDDPNDVWLEGVTYGMWDGPTLPDLEMVFGPTMRTNIYIQWNNKIIERAIRYRLNLETVHVGRVKAARLEVWNGQYGPTNDVKVFYTEFYNYGI